ncbi:MAG: NUDIX domain-containing protein [Rickettsiales bacterium]|jgi:isopentenyldiphosphate isomerase|nr:NUDIX domain-containing protein [Rickettsiales bacterium]
MAELLDIYDEAGRHIGTEDRNVVHAKGLWHRTVHCWLARGGNIIFQRRGSNLDNNPGKLYTTASGHIAAGETLEAAFAREIKEELGVGIESPIKTGEGKWTGDFKKTDGTDFHDRVFWTCFVAKTDVPLDRFRPQSEELDGLVEMDMRETLRLFGGAVDSIPATGYMQNGDGVFKLRDLTVTRPDFLLNPGETLEDKYDNIIRKILENLG